MLMANRILGAADDPDLHDAVHRHEHAGTREWVTLPRADMARRRLRVRTDKGREIAIALPRQTALYDGAVLYLDESVAVVARVEAEEWLRLRPRDLSAALMLGYHAGNLHWRARFDEGDLLVAVERERATYLDRLEGFFDDGSAHLVEPETEAAPLRQGGGG